jgi:succinyl-diaminopimelate desuccinylase
VLLDLLAEFVDIPSVSRDERRLADRVEELLRDTEHLEVVRDGDSVLARTRLGRPHRVLLAGHLDTVPIAGNLPSRREGRRLYGCGTSDMKGGVAVMAGLALDLAAPAHDVSYVFYDCEEIAAEHNGLGRISRTHREWLDADLAVLMEPTSGQVEAGCQGTLRATASLHGRRAHTARAWLGHNAIHDAGPLLTRLADYQARIVEIDGCTYREGLSAVAISGGVAGNVVPDLASVSVNFRFAPDRSVDDALDHVVTALGLGADDVVLDDAAPGALPGLDAPVVAQFIAHLHTTPVAKLGWTDVARFAELGIPAVNYGPGDPNLAHTAEEWVDLDLVETAYRKLAGYLG